MVNPQLSEYVSAQKLAGVADEEISKSLLGVGWPKEEVEAAIAVWASPIKAPELVANAEPVQVETTNSTFGDGSMMNVFDLGLPEKNPVYKPEQPQSDRPVEQPATPTSTGQVTNGGGAVNSSSTAAATPAATAVQNPVQQPTEPTKKGLGKFAIVALVFVVLGVLGGLVWFLVTKLNPTSTAPVALTVETPTPLPPTPTTYVMPEPASGGALLETQEFVSAKGFRITQPRNWVAEESGTLGTLVTFSNPNVDQEDGNKFAANINVTAEPAKGLSLDEHMRIGNETLQKTFTSYQKMDEKKIQVDGREAIMTEATFELGVHSLKVIQLVTIVDDSVYVITGTSFASKFDMYAEQMTASLMSFGV